MRRNILLSVVVGLVVAAVVACQIGHVRGAGQATAEFLMRRPAFYQLGCDGSPPREPVAFRFQELLRREYGIRIETIGGIGPSDFQADFVETYDSVMLWLMQRRHGEDFLDKLQKRARSDVFTHGIELLGEIHVSSREFIVAPRTFYSISGSEQAMALAKPLDGQLVRVTGTILDIRKSEWQQSGYASIQVERIQSEPTVTRPLPNSALQPTRTAAPASWVLK